MDRLQVLKVAELATPPTVVGLNCLKGLDRTDVSANKKGEKSKIYIFWNAYKSNMQKAHVVSERHS